MTEIVLIHGALVGPESLQPAAQELRQLGHIVHTPTVPAGALTAWADWPDALLADLAVASPVVIIGHSMGSRLAARLVAPLRATAFVSLDGDMPPTTGATPPVDASFLKIVDRLPQENGILPPWQEWWPGDPLEGVEVDADFRAHMFAGFPKLPRTWFDDSFEMTPWGDAGKGFVRLGAWYDEVANVAEQAGWATVRINGTHMHPATRPKETALAVQECLAQLACV